MKKVFLSLMAATVMCAFGHAEVKVTVTPLGDKPESNIRKKVTKADILVQEDFSAWKSGTASTPDYSASLATWDNPEIDPSLTHDVQWTGWKCYEAGGMCALRTFDPASSAYIITPKMDYSGSLEISFLAKYSLVEWEDEDGGMSHWTGSSISVALENDGDKPFELKDNDEDTYDQGVLLDDLRIYENDGWCEVTIEVDNYSAYNDASVVFYSSDGVLLDDIKVTSAMKTFIAAPVITGITDVTETSFTVNFEPVKKSFNYYVYLYEFLGYDEEGNPQLRLLLDPYTMESLEMYGISLDDYIESMGGESSPYVYYGQVDRKDPTKFTFEGLDPTKEYYYAICSHNVKMFSERKPMAANVIAAPELAAATDVKSDGFTANWKPVTKAENYEVNVYGVNKVQEDTDDFVIFEETFDNVSAYTSATDIFNPDYVDEESGLTIDDLTSTAGWKFSMKHALLVEGKFGMDEWNYKLFGPEVYVAGSDKVNLSLCVESTVDEFDLYFSFAGVKYMLPVTGGRFEDTVELPTNGLKETDFWIAADEAPVFIDYIMMSQALKAGDYTYTLLDKVATENGETSVSVNVEDADRFDFYGYSVKSMRGDIESMPGERMIVDLKSGSSVSGVGSVSGEVTEVERYSIDGRRINGVEKGINIIRYSDGSVRKIMVK